MIILSCKRLEKDWELSYKYIIKVNEYLVSEIYMTNTAHKLIEKNDGFRSFRKYLEGEAKIYNYYNIYVKLNDGKHHAIEFKGYAIEDSLEKESLKLLIKIILFCNEDFKKKINHNARTSM